MSRTMKAALTLCLTSALVGGVLAQGQQQPQIIGPGLLLFNPDVHKELKLSNEQSGKLKDSLTKVTAKYKDAFAKFQKAPPSPQEAEKVGKAFNDDSQKAIAGILDAKQLKRFKQIQWQLAGVGALHDPELQKELKLSDEQKKKLDGIVKEMTQKMQEMGKRGETSQAKYEAVAKEAEQKMKALLTEEQRKNYKELEGPEFKFSPPPQPAPAPKR
jgi:hypothetical protein